MTPEVLNTYGIIVCLESPMFSQIAPSIYIAHVLMLKLENGEAAADF